MCPVSLDVSGICMNHLWLKSGKQSSMMFGDEKEREKTRQVKLDRLFVAGGYIVSIRPLLAPLTLTVQNKGHGSVFSHRPRLHWRRKTWWTNSITVPICCILVSNWELKQILMWKSNVFALKCYVLFLYLFFIIYGGKKKNNVYRI